MLLLCKPGRELGLAFQDVVAVGWFANGANSILCEAESYDTAIVSPAPPELYKVAFL